MCQRLLFAVAIQRAPFGCALVGRDIRARAAKGERVCLPPSFPLHDVLKVVQMAAALRRLGSTRAAPQVVLQVGHKRRHAADSDADDAAANKVTVMAAATELTASGNMLALLSATAALRGAPVSPELSEAAAEAVAVAKRLRRQLAKDSCGGSAVQHPISEMAMSAAVVPVGVGPRTLSRTGSGFSDIAAVHAVDPGRAAVGVSSGAVRDVAARGGLAAAAVGVAFAKKLGKHGRSADIRATTRGNEDEISRQVQLLRIAEAEQRIKELQHLAGSTCSLHGVELPTAEVIQLLKRAPVSPRLAVALLAVGRELAASNAGPRIAGEPLCVEPHNRLPHQPAGCSTPLAWADDILDRPEELARSPAVTQLQMGRCHWLMGTAATVSGTSELHHYGLHLIRTGSTVAVPFVGASCLLRPATSPAVERLLPRAAAQAALLPPNASAAIEKLRAATAAAGHNYTWVVQEAKLLPAGLTGPPHLSC